ncbi:hypothetical protein KAW80_04435 [Candidatus Babeliales bacterium]|nr:hypothetical protein [Candidatus Babeliales bacterium]
MPEEEVFLGLCVASRELSLDDSNKFTKKNMDLLNRFLNHLFSFCIEKFPDSSARLPNQQADVAVFIRENMIYLNIFLKAISEHSQRTRADFSEFSESGSLGLRLMNSFKGFFDKKAREDRI